MKGKCTACGRSFAVSDENVGRKVRCECGHVFVIQSPVAEVAEEPVPLGISEPVPTRDMTSFARLHPKVFVAGSTVFLVITFVGGLALGLNIHPPDQHELEVGFKTGHKSGHDKGMQEGMNAGYTSGLADGIEEGKLIGAGDERNRLITKVNKADDKVRGLEATIDKNQQKHVEQLSETKTAARAEGYSAGRSEEREEWEERIQELKDTHAVELTRKTDEAYKQAEHDAGYQKWYDEGLAEGLKRGLHECRMEAIKEIEASKKTAYENGHAKGEQVGYKKGHREGRAKGRREGYDEGWQGGHDQGYDKGYKDGYRIAGGR